MPADGPVVPVTVVVARSVAGGREDEFYRFDDAAHLDAWERSDARAELLTDGAAFMRTVAVRRLDGMDPWFDTTRHRPATPPRWKTFLMTATVIFGLQSLVSAVLRPVVEDWPLLVRSAVTVVPVVALMTWLVMPRLSRMLGRWLYGSAR